MACRRENRETRKGHDHEREPGYPETDPADPLLVNGVNYVHSPCGIHAQNDLSGWEWMVQDGLGSVRGVVDDSLAVLQSVNYATYGEPFGITGSSQTNFGFTGEQTDDSGLLYLRADRIFALDPHTRSMVNSLWVKCASHRRQMTQFAQISHLELAAFAEIVAIPCFGPIVCDLIRRRRRQPPSSLP
jgi:hypothetical protein